MKLSSPAGNFPSGLISHHCLGLAGLCGFLEIMENVLRQIAEADNSTN